LNKKTLFICLFFVSCIGIGFAIPQYIGDANVSKPVIKNSATYVEFDLVTLTNKADYVVHGIVTKRDKSKKVKIPISTEIDIDDRNKGKFLETVETEVTLEVIDSIKNKDNKKSIIFNEEGGEMENAIIEPPGGALKIGDEVIIYLNQAGHSWGGQGILKIIDGKIKVNNSKEIKEYSLVELKTKLKNSIRE
jgi:hypothetical protein